jgi:hypothetical protein
LPPAQLAGMRAKRLIKSPHRRFMKSINPSLKWEQKSGKQCLKFVFDGKLTAQEAEIAILEWKEAFRSKADEPITLIWDCRKMESYENAARAKWTNALKELKPQIGAIWLISNSPLIRMGASVMGMLSSLNIKAVNAESEIAL